MSAQIILNALRQKHSDDVFVSECKNGATYTPQESLLMLDAWVLKKTWNPVTSIGYEVKVSRSDFKNDEKWEGYLPYCHHFYFVCPSGLILPEELPQNIGLMYLTKTGNKLITKKLSVRRDVELPRFVNLLLYVLMCRCSLRTHDAESVYSKEDRMGAYKKELELAKDRKQLASFINNHIKDKLLEAEYKLKEVNATKLYISDFEKKLSTLGIVWDFDKSSWSETRRVLDEISLLRKNVTQEDVYTLINVGKRISDIGFQLEEMKKKYDKDT